MVSSVARTAQLGLRLAAPCLFGVHVLSFRRAQVTRKIPVVDVRSRVIAFRARGTVAGKPFGRLRVTIRRRCPSCTSGSSNRTFPNSFGPHGSRRTVHSDSCWPLDSCTGSSRSAGRNWKCTRGRSTRGRSRCSPGSSSRASESSEHKPTRKDPARRRCRSCTLSNLERHWLAGIRQTGIARWAGTRSHWRSLGSRS